ncbi:RIMS-binding protein 2 [Nematolebias whitei]|uniref:RIMS-binding protein 2 n=1 Tax=Nematolebias whitei TaxID=451745 RepID=UPI001897B092|nr:RIMS-binding protein 2 [Nematolebias whitei]
MREVAERRQQLELEHEQALAILKFKQDEIKRLQRAQLFAKREHEGVVQMLESKVRDLEEKSRSQSEQFSLLSQELEKFRLQASKVDLASSSLLSNPSLSVLANGVGLTTEQDVAAALRLGSTPHAAGLSRTERSPVTKHRELPTISVSKSSSTKSETTHLTPKSDTHLSPHKSSPTHEVDTASEVEELDIDMAPASCSASRAAPKLQVFIARYSYNPYDGPNDNPEVELPLTAGEYIYVYGDMDDDGFYEGELMDGRRGLVPSNFVERMSDDDLMSSHHPETGDVSHNSLLDSSLHSASHQHHLHMGVIASERTGASAASGPSSALSDSASALPVLVPLTNGLDLDLEEVGVDIVPYPRKLTLIKQLAKSIIIGWDPPLVPAGWGNVWSYNVYVDQELRLSVPFGAQTKAVLERLDINLKAYRVSVQSTTEKGLSDQLRCSLLVGRDVSVAPTQLCVNRIMATSANLTWLPSNSNYVLEVASPTAGSALLGPSQIQSLQAAQELTVRTMSAHGESCDSLPVNVPSKLAAIMAGPAVVTPVVPPLPCSSLNFSPPQSYINSAAKVSVLPSTLPSDTHMPRHAAEGAANLPHALCSEDLLSSASYVKAWATPSSAAALAACEAASTITPVVNVMSPINTTSLPSPAAAPVSAVAPSPALDQRRDTDSPGSIRPFPSITEFIDDPSAKLVTHEPIPTPPKAPITDLLDPQSTNLLRPPSTSPLESEVEEDLENTRLVSIDEFLRQDQEPVYSRRQQSYARGPVEPLSNYHADNSRSDLSDILEEEEEDLYSDHLGEAQARGFTTGANREPCQVPPAVAGPSSGGQAELSCKAACSQAGLFKDKSSKMKGDCDTRIFVALFPYDPATMSPNPDAAEEELPFSEGQIIKVHGDKDADGFYRGESGGRLGYVPCNMVSEVQVEDEETRHQLLQQGFLPTATSMENMDPPQTAAPAAGGKLSSGPRKMVAIFDYDPRESSPNTDIEAELTFSAGDVIYVFGDMDEDGFFYGDLNGHRGLVPSNFLQPIPDYAPAEPVCAPPAPEPKKESLDTWTSTSEPLGSGPSTLEEALRPTTEPLHPDMPEDTDLRAQLQVTTSTAPDKDPVPGPASEEVCCSPPAPLPSGSPTPTDSSMQAKKKKSFFSKGKKLFKKLGSSKKE